MPFMALRAPRFRGFAFVTLGAVEQAQAAASKPQFSRGGELGGGAERGGVGGLGEELGSGWKVLGVGGGGCFGGAADVIQLLNLAQQRSPKMVDVL